MVDNSNSIHMLQIACRDVSATSLLTRYLSDGELFSYLNIDIKCLVDLSVFIIEFFPRQIEILWMLNSDLRYFRESDSVAESHLQ